MRKVRLFKVHHHEAGCIPHFIGKIPAGFHTLHVKTHIIARRISGDQSKSQRICPILADDFQRINSVAQGFAHLSSFVVSHESVDQHRVKRRFPCMLISGKHHSDNPEKDNVISGYQYVGRVEIIQFLRLFRPA